jgi:hypothetical protein
MKYRSQIVFWFLSVLIMSNILIGCASIEPITPSLIDTIGGQDIINTFQYFVSTDVLLSRMEVIEEKNTSVSRSGSVAVTNKIIKNKIKIKPTTYGALLDSYIDLDNRLILEICFEQDDTYRLVFAQYQPGQNNKFYILYDDSNQKLIRYGEYDYYLDYSDEEPPYLLIKIKSKNIEKTNSRTAPGRPINNH